MNKVGHISPIGGTDMSQGWDTCGTSGPFSYLFLSMFFPIGMGVVDG